MTNSIRATDPESVAFWAAVEKAAENVPKNLKGYRAVGIVEYPRGITSFVFAPDDPTPTAGTRPEDKR